MKILIIGIYPRASYGLAPAILKAYALRDSQIRKHTQIKIKYFSLFHTYQKILREIKEVEPSVIAFSCYIWNINKILKIARLMRASGMNQPIVVGGPEVSAIGGDILKENPAIDIVVRGEGEQTFLELVRHFFFEDKSLNEIPGVIFRDGKQIVANEQRSLIEYLDCIPSPYLNGVVDLGKTGPRVVLETYRGCAFDCHFCQWGKKREIRYFSLERVKEELIAIMKSKIRQVWFADAICNLNRDRFKDILEFIVKNNTMNMSFCFEVLAELLDQETVELLSRLRSGYLAFGLQSISPDALRSMNRQQDLKKFEKGVRMVQAKVKKMEVRIDLIYGLPGDNFSSYRKAIAYAMSFCPHIIQDHQLRILPGSHFYENASSYGIKFNKRAPHFIKETNTFSRNDLLAAHEWHLFLKIYIIPAVNVTVRQLSKHLNMAPFDVFEKILSYLKKYGELGSMETSDLHDHLSDFIRSILKGLEYAKQILPPFLELIEFLSAFEENRTSREAKRAKEKLPGIQMKTFNYDIARFSIENLYDRNADIGMVERRRTCVVFDTSRPDKIMFPVS